MRSHILVALVALFTLACAMPITPSAPRLQRRAEQFRLLGLREVRHAARVKLHLDQHRG